MLIRRIKGHVKNDFSSSFSFKPHKHAFITGLTGTDVHPGSWFNLPDFGITEWLQGSKSTSPSGSNAQVLGTQNQNTTPVGPPGPPAGYGTQTKTTSSSTPTTSGNSNLSRTITDAAQSQKDAAASAAEAARQAADRNYKGKVAAANTAKQGATDTYNWLIDTLGSNKQDTLKQIATNEDASASAYTKQQGDTQVKFDNSRQEILSTYRDLNTQQDKILRGSGQGQSSRSQEAALRLNSLMGKDLSNLSTQNADAMAVIGNAIAAVHSKAGELSSQIETSTKQQFDKAALEYKQQIDTINANTQLDDNARQDAYDAASAKLEADKANIDSWAAGLQVQAAQTTAGLKDQLDQFVLGNVNASGEATSDLGTLQKNAAGILQSAQGTTLDQGSTVADPTSGSFQSSVTIDDLKKALDNGSITLDQYNQQAAALQAAPQTLATATSPLAGGTVAAPTNPTLPNANSITSGAQADPLLAAIFGKTA